MEAFFNLTVPSIPSSSRPPSLVRPERVDPSPEVDVVVHLEWVHDLELEYRGDDKTIRVGQWTGPV